MNTSLRLAWRWSHAFCIATCFNCHVIVSYGVFPYSGFNEGMYSSADEWVIAKDLPEYEETFKRIAGSSSKISGTDAKPELVSHSILYTSAYISCWTRTLW